MSTKRNSLLAVVALLSAGIGPRPALATEGDEQAGYDPIQKALAGSDIAQPENPMTLSQNPAGLTSIPREITLGVDAFMPFRGYSTTGPGFLAPGPVSGTVNSNGNIFLLPNIAYAQPIDKDTTWGVAVYGSGGDNTGYPAVGNPSCAALGGGSGVFCGGKAGIDLKQVFIVPGIAHRFGDFSVGFSPVIAGQAFQAEGLGAFAGVSADPRRLTNQGASYSYGVGARLGLQWNATSALRFSASGTTPVIMSKFAAYSGLFVGGGSFNLPADVTVGAAYDVTPTLTAMMDYKHIFYSGVPAISNSTTSPTLFGSSNGPGFGWSDVNAIALGLEWRATKELTLRAGYAHNNNPVPSGGVTLNVLAPAVVTNHITGGASYAFNANSSVDFSAQYVPTGSVTGIEVTPQGPNPFRTITLNMHQLDLAVAYTYRW